MVDVAGTSFAAINLIPWTGSLPPMTGTEQSIVVAGQNFRSSSVNNADLVHELGDQAGTTVIVGTPSSVGQ